MSLRHVDVSAPPCTLLLPIEKKKSTSVHLPLTTFSDTMFVVFLVLIISITTASLGLLIYLSWKSPRRDAIIRRGIRDVVLVGKNLIALVLATFVMAYFQSIFGRNLAFYRHHQLADYVKNPELNLLHNRLYDLGFEVFPDLSNEESVLSANEGLQYCLAAAVIITLSIPYWFELKKGVVFPVHSVNVITRLLCTIAIGHVLRMPCYLVTSVPGPSPHCIGAIEYQNRPRDLSHVLWHAHTGANCGDLIFSGHMLFATTAICTVAHYVDIMFGRRKAYMVTMLLLPLFCMQVTLILMSRAHYSVDMVTGTIIGVMNWIVVAKVFWLNDAQATNDEPWAQFVTNYIRLILAKCGIEYEIALENSDSPTSTYMNFGQSALPPQHPVPVVSVAASFPAALVMRPIHSSTDDDTAGASLVPSPPPGKEADSVAVEVEFPTPCGGSSPEENDIPELSKQ
jgi:hypothetical protein